MVKKSEAGLPEGGTPEGETPQTTESVAPTMEELTAKLQEAETKAAQMEKNWKDAQRVASQKVERAEQLEVKRQDLEEVRDEIKILAAAMAQAQGKTEEEFGEETQAKKPDLLAQFQIMQAQRTVTGFQKRVEALGLTGEDDAYWEIKDLVELGIMPGQENKLRRAEIKLKRLEAEKAKTSKEEEKVPETKEPETPKSPLSKLTDEEKAALKHELLKEMNLLPTSTGGPSAGGKRSFTSEEIRAMSYEEFKANEKAIDEALQEGRIT